MIKKNESWIATGRRKSSVARVLMKAGKGSITINGVSLTITKIFKYGFQISIIPKTLRLTSLIYLKEKDLVNVEFDVLGKYIKNVIK